jgi:NADH:ubiquinone oxidoreductase subunit F (NADH-binding)
MTSAATRPVSAAGGAARPASGLPRLLPAGPNEQIQHLAQYGRAPHVTSDFIGTVEAAGLTGRGGAAFPTYRKLAIVAGQRSASKVVVANAAESEPASLKDKTLLQQAPHLVLDGLQLAADAVGASQVYLYLHRSRTPATAAIEAAIAERKAAGIDRRDILIAQAPPRFLAGQETALVSRVQGGPALPAFGFPRVSERGVGGAPTLVHNAETLAHLALIARYGPDWFRAVGTPREPGTMLTTIHVPGSRPQVTELPIGIPLGAILDTSSISAVLIGGYHGTWLPASQLNGLTLDNATLNLRGAALGAGVIAALPYGSCGLKEAARVVRYLAAESAGQCGPCLNGLPRIATAMAELAGPRPRQQTLDNLSRWAGLVTGRGACHHPDGTVRFVGSALETFAAELVCHRNGECTATIGPPFLPVPDTRTMPTTEQEWL